MLNFLKVFVLFLFCSANLHAQQYCGVGFCEQVQCPGAGFSAERDQCFTECENTCASEKAQCRQLAINGEQLDNKCQLLTGAYGPKRPQVEVDQDTGDCPEDDPFCTPKASNAQTQDSTTETLQQLTEAQASTTEKQDTALPNENYEQTGSNKSRSTASRRASFDPQTYILKAEKEAIACDQELDTGYRCCNDPLTCNANDGSRDQVGSLTNSALQLVSLTQSRSSLSIAESCKISEELSKLSTGIATATAAVCSRRKFLCSSKCASNISKAERTYTTCVSEAERAGYRKREAKKECKIVNELVAAIKGSKSDCSGLTEKAVQNSTHVASGLLATKLNKKCQESTLESGSQIKVSDITDCSQASNINSPFCRKERCNTQASSNDPICQNLNVSDLSTSHKGSSDLGSSGSGSGGDSDLASSGSITDADEFRQCLNIKRTEASAQNYQTNRAGGPSGLPSSVGSGFTGYQASNQVSAKRTPEQIRKANLKALFGRPKGGRGYARTYGSHRSSKYLKRNIYKRRSYNRTQSNFKKVNLKKYIPIPGSRKLASGFEHEGETIWRIIQRVHLKACNTGQLRDCK